MIGRAVAALAARQHGVVTRRQLLDVGLTEDQIDRRIAAGELHRVYRGVYAVGHLRLTREGRYIAAVLAAGDGAALADVHAADLLGLKSTRQIDVHVAAPRNRRPQPHLRIHRRCLSADEITMRQGIPVTSAATTIHDLAAALSEAQVEHLIRKAEYANLTTTTLLVEQLKNHPNRQGAKTLRAALANATQGKGITREELERRFKAFLREQAHPAPDYNQPIHLEHASYEVDCLWRGERLVVELDGRAAHLNAAAFEADRARDAALTAAGFRVIRITWRQLRDGPDRIAAQLRALLDAPRTPLRKANQSRIG